MKKLSIISVLTLAMVLMLGLGAKAQGGGFLAGGGLAYATDIDKPAVFVQGVYKITPKWEGAVDLTYFFPETVEGFGVKYTYTMVALNINPHYVFFAENKFEAYGLAGLSVLFGTVRTKVGSQSAESDTDSTVGLNLGAGGRYQISGNLYGMAEAKFVVRDGSYFQIGAGLLFNF